MKKDMSGTDRIIRIIVAVIAIVLYYTGTLTGTWGIVGLVVSGIFLLTGFVSFCPLYSIFGISSCSVKK
jgi:fatty acid desaturase